MPYWLVALPLTSKRKDASWELLQERTTGLSSNFKLDVPELRVGTLDTLMALSDDLTKTSNVMENVATKIRRQVHEFGGAAAVNGLKVEGMAVESYMQRFKWEEAKFPVRRPLKETVEKVTEVVGRIEDDLKVKLAEYNTLKSQVNSALRKASGSIAVRDVSAMVKPDQVVDSENLISLFVVVSKFNLKEWESTYETLSNFVVPRSSQHIAEDNDYALMSVVLFKRVVDDFKAAARSKGYQVREYVAPEGGEVSAAASAQLKRDVETKKAALEAWCRTAYGEVFSAWMHICVVRIFAESILRYGLPPAFQAAVIKPVDKQEGKLRTVLAQAFSDGKASYWKDDGSTLGAGLVDGSDLHPYVSFTLNWDS